MAGLVGRVAQRVLSAGIRQQAVRSAVRNLGSGGSLRGEQFSHESVAVFYGGLCHASFGVAAA